MTTIMNDIANFFNSGGGSDTILWFCVALILTLITVGTSEKTVRGLCISAYAAMFVSFFDFNIEYQVLLFAAVAVFFILREKSLRDEEREERNERKEDNTNE